MKSKKVLVTGATGRVGLNLIPELIKKNYEVTALVMQNDANLYKIKKFGVNIIYGNITNYNEVELAVQNVNAIVHLAAIMPAPTSTVKIDKTLTYDRFFQFDVNIKGTFNILEAARRLRPLPHLIFASTDHTYPVTLNRYLPVDENHPQNPITMYGLSKVLGEKMCLEYGTEFKMPITIARFGWVWAADEILNLFSLDWWIKRSGGIASESMETLKNKEDKLVCLLDENEKPLKIHVADVRDIVQGIILMLENDNAIGEVFNVAGPAPFAFDSAVKLLSNSIGKDYVCIKHPNYTTFHSYELSIAKAKCYLNFNPKYDIFKMIESALAFREGKDIGVISPF